MTSLKVKIVLLLLLIFTVVLSLSISEGKGMNKEVLMLAQTILGEAEGEKFAGKLAVGNVIMNRLKDGRFGKNLAGVIKKPYQFSCWNKGSPRLKVMEYPLKYTNKHIWLECQVAAKLVLDKDVPDETKGSTYYVHKRISKDPPYWLRQKDIIISIGAHVFYREPKT